MDKALPFADEPDKFVPWLFRRLREITDVEWDESVSPCHSSYDDWHVWGEYSAPPTSNITPTSSIHGSPIFSPLPSPPVTTVSTPHTSTVFAPARQKIVARVSKHMVRLERQYQLGKTVIANTDPEGRHLARALQLLRLPPRKAGDYPLCCIIYEWTGPNHLREMCSCGPAWYGLNGLSKDSPKDDPGPTSLTDFFGFAVGASECCEMLHQGNRIVHGELRPDSFHYNRHTTAVTLINLGSGVRSFEYGLTSAGWSTLSREIGVEHKLQFIAPEQTGRLPAAPDSRTDIYSLGIIFWCMLTGKIPFPAETPLEVMHGILSRHVPPVSSTDRLDVPDALSAVIQKMVCRNLNQRYHSATGLKWDLLQIQQLLSEGDSEALKVFKVGTKDVNCFFNLPNVVIGRDRERQAILNVIEKVVQQQRRAVPQSRTGLPAASSNSSSLESRIDTSFQAVDTVSDGASVQSTMGPIYDNFHSGGAPGHELFPGLLKCRSVENVGSGSLLDGPSEALKSQQFKRKGNCEVIILSGVAGLGKSCLVQSVQHVARSHGYFASAKFDQAKRTPFEPVLKVISSLFRTIFSESDVHSDFHNSLRSFVQPELVIVRPGQARAGATTPFLDPRKRPSLSHMKNDVRCGRAGQTTADFLRSGLSAKSSRAQTMFLDILRFLSHHKFLFICLDDLQFADEESLSLIQGIISSKIEIVLLLTYREKKALTPSAQSMVAAEGTAVTDIPLSALSEDDVAEYVSQTLFRKKDFVFPMVVVLMEKSHGNPFFVREMLDMCYRKECLWYDWKLSAWSYDLDKIFTVFSSDSYGSQINNDFILARLQDLPSNSRTLLAWGSMLGSPFSFTLVKTLMHGEGNSLSTEHEQPSLSRKIGLIREPSQDAMSGLQRAIAAYVLMPGEDDDHFQFCHDRYQQAAASLSECASLSEMHFSVAQIMMRSGHNEDSIFIKSAHICASVDLIKSRITHRSSYRNVLFQAAEKAVESGGRAAGLTYQNCALKLLQNNPWDESISSPDAHYQETLSLYTKSSENYFFQGFIEPAMALLDQTFRHARGAIDRAPSWVLHSRICARRGDSASAFASLRSCLAELGVDSPETSWDECDKMFHELRVKLQGIDQEKLLRQPLSEDRTLVTVGLVLCDIMTAAFWTDPLHFYQMGLIEVKVLLERGITTQAGLALIHFATCAIGRHDLVQFACDMGNLAQKFNHIFSNDYFSIGRAEALYCVLLGHFQHHVKALSPILENAMEASLSGGDQFSALLNIGHQAAVKLWQSQDFSEVETFCSYAAEELGNWQEDVRGGALLIALLQYCRALKGETFTGSASTVFSSPEHDTETYLGFIAERSSNFRPACDTYNTYMLIVLFLYGHHQAAVEIGESLMKTSSQWWSCRFVVSNIFYLCLSYIAVLRKDPGRLDRGLVLDRVRGYQEKIIRWSAANDTNLCVWSSILAAELFDLEGKCDQSLRSYESALDLGEVHGFTFEQAVTYELYADCLARRGANRLAKSSLRDSIAAYGRVSAFGKARHVADNHEYLLLGTKSVFTADAACQTLSTDDNRPVQKVVENEDLGKQMHRAQVLSEHGNVSSKLNNASNVEGRQEPGLEALGLDMIDLTGILQSSQVLSSELQVDRLRQKMTRIILESTGAELCAIVVEDEDLGWTIAAVSDSSGHDLPVGGQSLDTVEDVVGKQITLYTLRFRETVFLDNNLEDDRFSVDDLYRAKNPSGKAVLTMPIVRGDQVLGAVYLEGPPHSFTERNITVLRLLVNSISISITNASLFKKVEKVSASNLVMIESQKHALAQARKSEKKAKLAEAEAVRNVKLQEEAVKAKSIFLANVSHELRTPLNGVIGMSELLKGSNLNPEQEGYAESIRVCADTLLIVINDILDFSKLEAGKMHMLSVPLSLTETIGEVVRALSYSNMDKDLRTVVELDLDKDLLVMGDPVRLHQILMNLLSNSYKFTSKGSVTVKATVVHEDDKDITVTCSVADTGLGISDEQQKLLFQPFSQADSSTARSYGGTGLGLSICKAIIETVMGGQIWLDSEPKVGTKVSFTLTFPKVSRTGPGGTIASPSHREPNLTAHSLSPEESNPARLLRRGADLTTIPRNQLRFCIAEDNPINQKIAISFVKKLGFICEAFDDGQQALDALIKAAAADKPFHVLLLDIMMPVLDGYDTTREIRKHPNPAVNEVLIIAMTASAIQGDREKCLEAGMNNYLAKPVRQLVLKQMLEGYLSNTPTDPPSETLTTDIVSKKANGNGQTDDMKRSGVAVKAQ